MKKVVIIAIVLSFGLTLFGFSNAQAVTTTSLHTATSGVVKPGATTVYCWLPHDIELTNPDATWCISGSGQVNTYNVSKIVNVSSNTHYPCDQTHLVNFTLPPHSTRNFSPPIHITCV